MIEFAVVLFVKQQLEWKKDEYNGKPVRLNLETSSPEKKTRLFRRNDRVDKIEKISKAIKKQRITKRYSEVNHVRFWMVSSATNRIDFVSFAMFLLGYIVFNCVYWFHYTSLYQHVD